MTKPTIGFANEFNRLTNQESQLDHERSVAELKQTVQTFCEDRDWDQFHDAKELAIGMCTEAGELLQHFRFLSREQISELFENTEKTEMISSELADVLFFALRFSQLYNIDLAKALSDKISKNALKYPIEKSKGCNLKYSDL
jgi:NTP pyrophosphatase (non-canonical NTP hydrolase)